MGDLFNKFWKKNNIFGKLWEKTLGKPFHTKKHTCLAIPPQRNLLQVKKYSDFHEKEEKNFLQGVIPGTDLEDLTFEQKKELLKIIYRHDSKEAHNPMVSEFVKEKMYSLHVSDPVSFTFPKLATIFGVPRQRVRAIVLFKIEEHQRRRENLWVGDSEIEELLEEQFGVLISGRQEISQKHYRMPTPFDNLDEDIDLFQFHVDKQKRRKGPRRELPVEPPHKYESLRKSYLIQPREDRPMRTYKIYLVDISGRFSFFFFDLIL